MVSEMRNRLTQELTREKERALKEQEVKFKEKLKKQRQSFSNKLKSKRPKSKILSPLELYKQQLKHAKEVKEFRKYKYQSSRTGKIGKGIDAVTLQRLRAIAYARSLRLRNQSRGSNPQGGRFAPRTSSHGPWWDGHFAALQVEKEVSGMGTSSLHSEGDRVANQLGKEVGFYGNFSLPPHARNVSREAQLHSQITDINPTLQLEREVNAFANVLNPRAKRGRR